MPLDRNALRRRAVRDGGVRAGEPVQLLVGRVHVVGEHRAVAQQPGVLVGADVVAGLREQLFDERDLARALVHVAREQRGRVLVEQRPAGAEHLLGRGHAEARRDGVAQAAVAVPALDQLRAFGVGISGVTSSSGRRLRSETTRPDAIRRPLLVRGFEERVLGLREVAAEHERRRGPVAREQPREALGGLGARARGRPSWPPRAASAARATRAAPAPSPRSPGSADSARACRPCPGSARSRAGRGSPRRDAPRRPSSCGPGGEDCAVGERDRPVVERLERVARRERIARRVRDAGAQNRGARHPKQPTAAHGGPMRVSARPLVARARGP